MKPQPHEDAGARPGCRRRGRRPDAGFTLVELSVSIAILTATIALSLGAFGYFLHHTHEHSVQNDLDIDVQKSMERIKKDLRLSALDKIFYYPPGPGPYTAMSFPMARDDDGNGMVETDANGKIIWDKTVIYHVWAGRPNELRLTTFDPRDNTLTDAQMQEQLTSVVTNGHGRSTHSGNQASTTVIFANLFDWTVSPVGYRFDGYSVETSRAVNVGMGSTILGPGTNLFKFALVGRNPAATTNGFRVGVDTLVASSSHGVREGENQLPATAVAGPQPLAQYMSNGSWSANHYLLFPCATNGGTFTLGIENDRWEETNFRGPGHSVEGTRVLFEKAEGLNDFVVKLEGMDTNWMAASQAGTAGSPTAFDALRGAAVRVSIHGKEMPAGGFITASGDRVKVCFRAGSSGGHALRILAATIAEAADVSTNAPTQTGRTNLTFGGAATALIPAGTRLWSDLATYRMDSSKSYVVSYLVDAATNTGTSWTWSSPDSASYVVPGADLAVLAQDNWQTRSDTQTVSAILGVEQIFVTHPAVGAYESPVFDTRTDFPAYADVAWRATNLQTNVTLKLRTSASSTMAGATPWSNIVARTAPGLLTTLPSQRYIQFQAILRSDAARTNSPMLQDVTVRWPGPLTVVDVGGSFTTGPDFGIFEVTVNGEKLKMGVVVDLEIYDDVTSFGAVRKRLTSALSAEVMPRNTGK